jgi:sirohydrochlorin ferrochelatase
MKGYIIFAHGSRIESANTAVRDLVQQFCSTGGHLAEAAFLDLAEPSLARAVELLVHRGASEVVVIPYFLTLGLHLQRDLPQLVADVTAGFAGLTISVAPPLDGHPALLAAVLDRARESA